jgi:hypothetical protein
MVSLRQHGSGSRLLGLAKRAPFALLPLVAIGSLALAPAPASAATSAAGTDPTVAAFEAQVTAAVDQVLSASVPLVGSLGCVPYDVTSLLSGGRVYPC